MLPEITLPALIPIDDAARLIPWRYPVFKQAVYVLSPFMLVLSPVFL